MNDIIRITKHTPQPLTIQPHTVYPLPSHEMDIVIYDRWRDITQGRSHGGTICIPYAADVGITGACPTAYSPTQEEIQNQWNQTLYDSNNQNAVNNTRDLMNQEEAKCKKLELILMQALRSGNLDMAVLLLSGLETSRSNSITAGLMGRIENLQQQRKTIAEQMAKLGNDAQAAQQGSSLNLQASNIATDISLLQTFLQEVSSEKQEAQTFASNFIKNRHETAMGILRN